MPQTTDPVADLLRRAPLPDAVRADVWDAYDKAKDADELVTALGRFPLPQTVKADLWDLKSKAQPAVTTQPVEQPATTQPGGLVEFGKGVVKSGLGLVEGAGQMIRSIPGVGPLLSAGPEVTLPVSTKASNPSQNVGKTIGDIAQFFVPGVGTGGRLVRGAKAAGLTMAQAGGDSPVAAGVSGTLAAALPGAGAARRVAATLETSAEKAMSRALGPTKEVNKATAAKIVPGLIERGVKGSRAQMLQQAEVKTAEFGKAINAEIEAAAARGESIAGLPIRQALEHATEQLATFDAQGVARIIPGTETVVKRLAKLDQFVATLGDDIPIDQAAKIKRVFDRIVSKAGLYGQRVGASATDSANAWATREASGAFRQLVNKGNVTLEGLNKEFGFWKGVKDVLSQTALRTQGQSGGLTGVVMAGAGATAGAMTGGSLTDRFQNAVIGGVAGKQIVKLLNSPQWLTRVSVPMRTLLADALASGNAKRIESALRVVATALPSQAAQ